MFLINIINDFIAAFLIRFHEIAHVIHVRIFNAKTLGSGMAEMFWLIIVPFGSIWILGSLACYIEKSVAEKNPGGVS